MNTKYTIIHENENSISVFCEGENGKGCTVTRMKNPPTHDILGREIKRNLIDLEADSIIEEARRQLARKEEVRE